MKFLIALAFLAFNGCLMGCVSEGAGWRLQFQTAGFVIEYTVTADKDGEHKFRQSFDQEGWSIIGPWLADEEEGPPAPEPSLES
jgi:hypothetical protein